MNKAAKITIISVIVATTGFAALSASAGWRGHQGYCNDGKPGMGPAMMMNKMAGSGRFADRDLNLTVDDARTLVEARLIMRGNDRLKVGQVAEKDADTLVVDIVTVDDSLVRQIEIDRDKGLPRGRFAPVK